MKIMDLSLLNPVILAPMAGITDRTYRQLAKEQGCALVFTEMISAKGLVYGNSATREMLLLSARERPLAVQLFGSEPDLMAEATRIIDSMPVDLIDINMGCPVAKVVRNGEGAALMKTPRLAAEIVAAVAKATKLPVTVKIRKGWDNESSDAVYFASRMAAVGARAVTVHGRTRSQLYSGSADWGIIKQVKKALTVPVIGNGDIFQPEDAAKMMELTGCDAVMLARGTLGNPWLISHTITYLATGRQVLPPSLKKRILMALYHLDLLISDKGEERGVREMRKFAAWYLKGLPHSASVRNLVTKAKTRHEMRSILLEYQISQDKLSIS